MDARMFRSVPGILEILGLTRTVLLNSPAFSLLERGTLLDQNEQAGMLQDVMQGHRILSIERGVEGSGPLTRPATWL